MILIRKGFSINLQQKKKNIIAYGRKAHSENVHAMNTRIMTETFGMPEEWILCVSVHPV